MTPAPIERLRKNLRSSTWYVSESDRGERIEPFERRWKFEELDQGNEERGGKRYRLSTEDDESLSASKIEHREKVRGG